MSTFRDHAVLVEHDLFRKPVFTFRDHAVSPKPQLKPCGAVATLTGLAAATPYQHTAPPRARTAGALPRHYDTTTTNNRRMPQNQPAANQI
jgi:hypothetical protein